jgi:4-alpha-glucanotransferase
VPNHIRANMIDAGLQRMYVAQFEFDANPEQAMRPVPSQSLAALNTHDMRPFAGFWEGADIDDQVDLGLLKEETGSRQWRKQIRQALVEYLRRRGRLRGPDPQVNEIAGACMEELAASPGALLLVNLEDLWAEPLPQNTPGTVEERPNWSRRAKYSFEEFANMPEVVEVLRRIDQLRRAGP